MIYFCIKIGVFVPKTNKKSENECHNPQKLPFVQRKRN